MRRARRPRSRSKGRTADHDTGHAVRPGFHRSSCSYGSSSRRPSTPRAREGAGFVSRRCAHGQHAMAGFLSKCSGWRGFRRCPVPMPPSDPLTSDTRARFSRMGTGRVVSGYGSVLVLVSAIVHLAESGKIAQRSVGLHVPPLEARPNGLLDYVVDRLAGRQGGQVHES